MKNYTWTTTDLYTVDTDTQTNYVVDVVYEVVGTETNDGTEYTSSISNTATFEVEDGDNFVAFADLTNAIVIGWVKEQLGAVNISNLEASVGGMIDSQITPPVAPAKTDLPW